MGTFEEKAPSSYSGSGVHWVGEKTNLLTLLRYVWPFTLSILLSLA